VLTEFLLLQIHFFPSAHFIIFYCLFPPTTGSLKVEKIITFLMIYLIIGLSLFLVKKKFYFFS
jgi:hypothetical protein